MSGEIKKLLEQRAQLITNARSKRDEITDQTDEARAAEIEREFDAMITEAEGIDQKIERLQRLERLEGRLSEGDPRRPSGGDGEGRGADQPEGVSYRAAFHAYLAAQGQESEMDPAMRAALREGYTAFSKEQRAQTAGTVTAGGHIVPDEMMQPIVKAMAAWGPMYDEDICTTITTAGGGSIPIPTVDDTAVAAEASTEGAALTDDGGKDVTFGKGTLDDFMFDTEWLRVSVQLATGAFTNMEDFLSMLLGERLGRKANAQLTTGTGSSAPQGIVTGSAAGKTAAATAAVTADEVLDLIHAVDPAYRGSPKARAMFNDSTLLALHKLKDGQGNYLIQEAPDGRGRLRIGAVTVPYSINQAMASMAANAKPIVYGDFSRYMVRKIGSPIVGALQDKDFWPGFGVAGYVRLDGVLADTAAVKHMVMAAA